MDAVTLVATWNVLVQSLAVTFTDATVRTWQQIVLGWVLHRGPATVTGMIGVLGDLADRHWTVYHRFFYRAAWSLQGLSQQLMIRIIQPLIMESGAIDSATGKPVVDLNIDDTTAGRYGRHVAHAGWYKDASATGPAIKGTVIHWAHNWIVGAFTLRLPRWPKLRWVLPALFALYRKKSDCGSDHPFATRQSLALQLIKDAAAALKNVVIRIAVDGAYATREFLRNLPESVNAVSRIRRDAALHDLPPKRRRGQRGRPRLKGRRLPTPKTLASRRKKNWRRITVSRQGREVSRLVLGITCLWYHVCGSKPIRLVIVRDPAGRQDDDFFFCTDAEVPDEQIVQRYYDRWGVEEAILEAKQHLGFEDTRGWCSRTVHRQAPLAMVLVTLVKAWYHRCTATDSSLLPEAPPWNPDKSRPSFADMLSSLRRALWEERILRNSRLSRRVREIIASLGRAMFRAA